MRCDFCNSLRAHVLGVHVPIAHCALLHCRYAKIIEDFVSRSGPIATSAEVANGNAAIQAQYAEVVAASRHRGARLVVAESMLQLRLDCAESEGWLAEREDVLQGQQTGEDMLVTLRHIARVEKLGVELDGYKGVSQSQAQLKGIVAAWDAVLIGATTAGGGAPCVVAPAPATPVADEGPTLKAGYAYKARTPQELDLKKGEPLVLINPKNADWWKVETANGDVG